MKLLIALEIANRLRSELWPYCERIEIAGSIRRKKPEVKDIEFVAIPKQGTIDLFSNESAPVIEFCNIVNQWPAVKGKPEGKYTQRIIEPEGIKLDLFIAEPGSWGLQLAIRTGSAEYSHKVLASGWVKAGYKSEGGYLFKGGQRFEIREEEDLFRLIGIPWIQPEKRSM